MARQTLKDMAKSREIKLGHFIVEFTTPGIGHILKQAGCDFALFDMEHSGFGIRDRQERASAISRPLAWRRSCAFRRRSTITSPVPATWGPRA